MNISVVNFAGDSFCWNYATDTCYSNYAGDNVCSNYIAFWVPFQLCRWYFNGGSYRCKYASDCSTYAGGGFCRTYVGENVVIMQVGVSAAITKMVVLYT